MSATAFLRRIPWGSVFGLSAFVALVAWEIAVRWKPEDFGKTAPATLVCNLGKSIRPPIEQGVASLAAVVGKTPAGIVILLGLFAMLALVTYSLLLWSRGGANSRGNFLVRASPWLFTIALFVIWEISVYAFAVPTFFLPPPTTIGCAFDDYWKAIYNNSRFTLEATLLGFALAVGFGLLLGLVIGWSKTIYSGLYPLMIGFNAIPKVAVVPILVLWFGIGFVPAVLTAFLISFFPIVVNVATGLATIEPELEDVLKALGASKLDIMRKVGIPRSLPYFFGSLKIAITLAFVGSVISESVASNYGIGNLMLQAQAQFQVPLIFAGLIALAVEGIVMYWLMAMLETRMTRWAHRSGFAQG
jgi:NitT/TauT family transport system permease protein